ncbi:phage gp6-like head-tail connector protein [Vibrio parahaemolyticus]|nr:phage gp6-like head-tail connector protein [Vibrio parahaemolyticus]
MHYTIISKTDVTDELLPLEEVMEYLRVYDYQEEQLLNVYRKAAINFAETYMNRVFGYVEVIATFDSFKQELYLPLGLVASVHEVTAYRNDELISIGSYRHNAVSGRLRFTKDYSDCTEFTVRYSVAYPVEVIPQAIKIGMLKLIATWYENREDISNGVSISEVPNNHRYCFDMYRLKSMG